MKSVLICSAGLVLAAPALASSPQAGLDPALAARALAVVACAQRAGHGTGARNVTIIDYGRASLVPRLWVVDIGTGAVRMEEHVAHGRGSGDNLPSRFSNREGSHQTSLGLFVTAETYVGQNGYSLRLDGLVPGVNDAARARAIVVHGASYVNPVAGKVQGRLGRSWGCPAVREAVARGLIDTIKGGNFVFAHHPDRDWVEDSAFGRCPAVAAREAVGRAAASR
jgi:hypothetical protein